MVERFSPVGVKGLTLPAEYSNSSYNHSMKAEEGPLTCGEPMPLVPFRHAGVTFKRVVIPVVFHCEYVGPNLKRDVLSASTLTTLACPQCIDECLPARCMPSQALSDTVR